MKTEFRFGPFNGKMQLILEPENEDDKRLLELTFNGREVREIKAADGGSIVLEMARSGEKKA